MILPVNPQVLIDEVSLYIGIISGEWAKKKPGDFQGRKRPGGWVIFSCQIESYCHVTQDECASQISGNQLKMSKNEFPQLIKLKMSYLRLFPRD